MAREFVVLSFDRLVGLLGHATLMPQAVFEIGVTNIVFAMKKCSFALYDIIGITCHALDQAMAEVDAVFVPEMPPLYSDRQWSNLIGFPAPVPANEEAAGSTLSESGRCIGGHG